MIKAMSKEELIEKLFYYLYITVFVAIIYFRNVLDLNIPIIITTFLTIIYMALSHKTIPEIFAFLISFRSAIQGNYILMTAMFIYLLKEKKSIRIDKSIILVFIILIIELLNIFNTYSNIKDYITFAFTILLIYFIVYSNDSEHEKKEIIKNYILGTFLATMIFLFKTLKAVPILEFINLRYRLGTLSKVFDYSRYDLNYNANELALHVVVAIAMLLTYKDKGKINKALYYMLILYFFIIGMFTMSRAFLLTALIVFAMYIYDNRKNIKKTFTSIFIILAVFILIINYTSLFSHGLIDNFRQRFEEKDLSGGRTTIIETYNKIFFSSSRNILIGCGIQNYNLKNNYKYSSHNATQEVFVCWGTIGGITFISLIYCFYKKSRNKEIRYNLTTYLPFTALLLIIQTIPFISQGTIVFMFYIVLAPFALKENSKEKKENVQNGKIKTFKKNEIFN